MPTRPAINRSMSPASNIVRIGGDHQSSDPAAAARQDPAADTPAPRADRANTNGTSTQTPNSIPLYVAAACSVPTTASTNSAGRLPPSNTGVFGYPAWNDGS